MKNKYRFNTRDKFIFYLHYIYSKTQIPLEVNNDKKNIIITELIWTSSKVLKFKPFIIKKLAKDYYETKLGKFYITPDLISTIAVSPSFERRELRMLLDFIEKDVNKNLKILFIDVGAFFGLYTVAVGNRFKKYNKIDICTFEPGTYYLSKPTLDLLERNIKKNNIKNVKLFKFGLGSLNSQKNKKTNFQIKKLDSVLSKKYIKSFDKVYIKIDVDGDKKKVLKGSQKTIESSKNMILLIEDFVDKKIILNLEKDFEFMSKPSVYNSFWHKKSQN